MGLSRFAYTPAPEDDDKTPSRFAENLAAQTGLPAESVIERLPEYFEEQRALADYVTALRALSASLGKRKADRKR